MREKQMGIVAVPPIKWCFCYRMNARCSMRFIITTPCCLTMWWVERFFNSLILFCNKMQSYNLYFIFSFCGFFLKIVIKLKYTHTCTSTRKHTTHHTHVCGVFLFVYAHCEAVTNHHWKVLITTCFVQCLFNMKFFSLVSFSLWKVKRTLSSPDHKKKFSASVFSWNVALLGPKPSALN